MKSNCGVVYVATGEKFVLEAQKSVRHLKNHCPDVPAVLFTDLSVDSGLFDKIKSISTPHYGFLDRIEQLQKSEFKKTLHLDCDTCVVDPEGVYEIFDLLEQFDFVAAHDTDRTAPANGELKQAYDAGVPDSFPMFNGGVFAFRNSEGIEQLLQDWEYKYRTHIDVDPSATDQESLRSALFESDLRIATLSSEYNFRVPYPQTVSDKVKILHGRAKNYGEISEKINQNSGELRYYVPAHIGREGLTSDYETVRPLINPGKEKIIREKIKLSIIEYGIMWTFIYLLNGGIQTGRFRYETLRQSITEEGLLETFKKLYLWGRGENINW